MLHDAGAEIDDRDIADCTALMHAAQFGKLTLVKLLVAKGADVNARADENVTALHWAVIRGHVEVAKFLLRSGADPHVVWERKGSFPMKRGTPFDIARKNKNEKMLKLFAAQPKKK